MRTRRRVACCRFIFIAVALVFATALFFPSHSEARRKSLQAGKDVKGITFDEFWAKVHEEGTKWAGNRLRVRRIVSVPVVGFDGRGGRSPVWEAQLVRCDSARAQDTAEEGAVASNICKGRSVTIRVVESGVSGEEAGIRTSKEIYFRGPVVRTDRIKIGAGLAEDTANNHKNYHPVETDNYTYELKFDQRGDRPVWVIKRTCGYKGRSSGRCMPGDHWIVKVDAESGEVVKIEKRPKRLEQSEPLERP